MAALVAAEVAAEAAIVRDEHVNRQQLMICSRHEGEDFERKVEKEREQDEEETRFSEEDASKVPPHKIHESKENKIHESKRNIMNLKA